MGVWCASTKARKMCRTCLKDALSLKANLSGSSEIMLGFVNPSYPAGFPMATSLRHTETAECLFSTPVENLWHSKSPKWKMPPVASVDFFNNEMCFYVIHCLLNGIHQRAIDAMIAWSHAKQTGYHRQRLQQLRCCLLPLPHLLGRDSSW